MKTNQQTIVPLIMAVCLFEFSACSKRESSPEEIARFETLKRGVDSLDEQYEWSDGHKLMALKKKGDLKAIKQLEQESANRPPMRYYEFVKQLGEPDLFGLNAGQGTARWIEEVKGAEESEDKRISIKVGYNSQNNQILELAVETKEAEYSNNISMNFTGDGKSVKSIYVLRSGSVKIKER